MSKTTTDPISDMLTRIRNSIMVNKNEVIIPYSKIKLAILELLIENHFLKSMSTVELPSVGKLIKLVINDDLSNANITELKRISKPGRRLYVPSKEIPKIKKGRGIVIVSTSQGLMTGDNAKKLNLGGELVCQIY